MTCHIVKQAKLDQLTLHFSQISGSSGVDMEDQNIESRITQARAQELLVEWKKILIEYEGQGKNLSTLLIGSEATDGYQRVSDASSELEGLKDKLFIATGEDQLDTWEAFTHYKLNPNVVTEHDRQTLV